MAARMMRDWQAVQKHDHVQTAELINDQMHTWRLLLKGPSESPYAGGVFEVRVDLPPEYPLKAPKVVFVTPIFHPNFKFSEEKRVFEFCSDVIKEWHIKTTMADVITAVVNMIAFPDPDGGVNVEAVELLRRDKDAFVARAAADTKRFAMQ